MDEKNQINALLIKPAHQMIFYSKLACYTIELKKTRQFNETYINNNCTFGIIFIHSKI